MRLVNAVAFRRFDCQGVNRSSPDDGMVDWRTERLVEERDGVILASEVRGLSEYSSSRRLGAYPIGKIRLDRRITVKSRNSTGTRRKSRPRGRSRTPIDCLFTRQTAAALRAGSSFQIHPFLRGARTRGASRLEYPPDKTVSFPSQSIFARPTHSRL